jgi:hypothetical protein
VRRLFLASQRDGTTELCTSAGWFRRASFRFAPLYYTLIVCSLICPVPPRPTLKSAEMKLTLEINSLTRRLNSCRDVSLRLKSHNFFHYPSPGANGLRALTSKKRSIGSSDVAADADMDADFVPSSVLKIINVLSGLAPTRRTDVTRN